MIRLKDLLTEGWFEPDLALKPHEKLLVGSVTEFMRNKFGISAKIIVKKVSGMAGAKPSHIIGDVPLSTNSVNNNKFYVHFSALLSYRYQIEVLFHELTHVKQISKKELGPDADWKNVQWKGKDYISAKDYNKVLRSKDFKTYVSFPWEIEARRNEESLLPIFLKSKELKSTLGKDPNWDYIIDNI